MEVSIEEKVKAVFEWAGFKTVTDINDETYWVAPDGKAVTMKDGYYLYDLPIPDDIEFLGYMDKYVIPKLQDKYRYLKISTVFDKVALTGKGCCLVILYKFNITIDTLWESAVEGRGNDYPTALLNSIYEVIK